MSTIFGKIIAGELPAKKVFENERILVIEDIAPKARVHLLILPKKEFTSLQQMGEADLPLLGEIVKVTQKLAKDFQIEDGYRFLTNVGAIAGQTVYHLHFHLIGGEPLGDIA